MRYRTGDGSIVATVLRTSLPFCRSVRDEELYGEAGSGAAVATGYDPLLDNEPQLPRTMAASVTRRITCGKRAGEQVRRISSGFGGAGERPALTGPRCASVNGS